MAATVPKQKAMKREIELDFIRGIAILLVIDFHSPQGVLLAPFGWLGWKNFGWVGVDVFFVLSGFLVGGLLVKEWRVRGRIDSKRFLIRRGFKIWPQYYVFIFLMLATRHRTPTELWGNLLNIQNYVGGIAHTWSLAVEEHAYILLVALLAIAAQWRTRMRNLFLLIAGTTLCVMAGSLILSIMGYNTFPTTHTRIDGILEGVLLAIVYHYVPDTFRRMQQRVWIWIAMLVAGLLYLRFQQDVPWQAAMSWIAANGMGIALLMLLYRHREGARRSALYRMVAWTGLYSYGIYLWHVSVLRYVVAWGGRLPAIARPIWAGLGPTILAIAIGFIFTKVVEFPALRLRDRLFPRRVDSAVGIPAEIEESILKAKML